MAMHEKSFYDCPHNPTAESRLKGQLTHIPKPLEIKRVIPKTITAMK